LEPYQNKNNYETISSLALSILFSGLLANLIAQDKEEKKSFEAENPIALKVLSLLWNFGAKNHIQSGLSGPFFENFQW